eukprot:GHVH01013048.1.p1 GENE.GHVH01013048.1~~GHVH01013048.1.p1  ORF type:complete len:3027 (+),score=388.42 GHVH01013048.1:252-9332(+)
MTWSSTDDGVVRSLLKTDSNVQNEMRKRQKTAAAPSGVLLNILTEIMHLPAKTSRERRSAVQDSGSLLNNVKWSNKVDEDTTTFGDKIDLTQHFQLKTLIPLVHNTLELLESVLPDDSGLSIPIVNILENLLKTSEEEEHQRKRTRCTGDDKCDPCCLLTLVALLRLVISFNLESGLGGLSSQGLPGGARPMGSLIPISPPAQVNQKKVDKQSDAFLLMINEYSQTWRGFLENGQLSLKAVHWLLQYTLVLLDKTALNDTEYGEDTVAIFTAFTLPSFDLFFGLLFSCSSSESLFEDIFLKWSLSLNPVLINLVNSIPVGSNGKEDKLYHDVLLSDPRVQNVLMDSTVTTTISKVFNYVLEQTKSSSVLWLKSHRQGSLKNTGRTSESKMIGGSLPTTSLANSIRHGLAQPLVLLLRLMAKLEYLSLISDYVSRHSNRSRGKRARLSTVPPGIYSRGEGGENFGLDICLNPYSRVLLIFQQLADCKQIEKPPIGLELPDNFNRVIMKLIEHGSTDSSAVIDYLSTIACHMTNDQLRDPFHVLAKLWWNSGDVHRNVISILKDIFKKMNQSFLIEQRSLDLSLTWYQGFFTHVLSGIETGAMKRKALGWTGKSIRLHPHSLPGNDYSLSTLSPSNSADETLVRDLRNLWCLVVVHFLQCAPFTNGMQVQFDGHLKFDDFLVKTIHLVSHCLEQLSFIHPAYTASFGTFLNDSLLPNSFSMSLSKHFKRISKDLHSTTTTTRSSSVTSGVATASSRSSLNSSSLVMMTGLRPEKMDSEGQIDQRKSSATSLPPVEHLPMSTWLDSTQSTQVQRSRASVSDYRVETSPKSPSCVLLGPQNHHSKPPRDDVEDNVRMTQLDVPLQETQIVDFEGLDYLFAGGSNKINSTFEAQNRTHKQLTLRLGLVFEIILNSILTTCDQISEFETVGLDGDDSGFDIPVQFRPLLTILFLLETVVHRWIPVLLLIGAVDTTTTTTTEAEDDTKATSGACPPFIIQIVYTLLSWIANGSVSSSKLILYNGCDDQAWTFPCTKTFKKKSSLANQMILASIINIVRQIRPLILSNTPECPTFMDKVRGSLFNEAATLSSDLSFFCFLSLHDCAVLLQKEWSTTSTARSFIYHSMTPQLIFYLHHLPSAMLFQGGKVPRSVSIAIETESFTQEALTPERDSVPLWSVDERNQIWLISMIHSMVVERQSRLVDVFHRTADLKQRRSDDNYDTSLRYLHVCFPPLHCVIAPSLLPSTFKPSTSQLLPSIDNPMPRPLLIAVLSDVLLEFTSWTSISSATGRLLFLISTWAFVFEYRFFIRCLSHNDVPAVTDFCRAKNENGTTSQELAGYQLVDQLVILTVDIVSSLMNKHHKSSSSSSSRRSLLQHSLSNNVEFLDKAAPFKHSFSKLSDLLKMVSSSDATSTDYGPQFDSHCGGVLIHRLGEAHGLELLANADEEEITLLCDRLSNLPPNIYHQTLSLAIRFRMNSEKVSPFPELNSMRMSIDRELPSLIQFNEVFSGGAIGKYCKECVVFGVTAESVNLSLVYLAIEFCSTSQSVSQLTGATKTWIARMGLSGSDLMMGLGLRPPTSRLSTEALPQFATSLSHAYCGFDLSKFSHKIEDCEGRRVEEDGTDYNDGGIRWANAMGVLIGYCLSITPHRYLRSFLVPHDCDLSSTTTSSAIHSPSKSSSAPLSEILYQSMLTILSSHVEDSDCQSSKEQIITGIILKSCRPFLKLHITSCSKDNIVTEIITDNLLMQDALNKVAIHGGDNSNKMDVSRWFESTTKQLNPFTGDEAEGMEQCIKVVLDALEIVKEVSIVKKLDLSLNIGITGHSLSHESILKIICTHSENREPGSLINIIASGIDANNQIICQILMNDEKACFDRRRTYQYIPLALLLWQAVHQDDFRNYWTSFLSTCLIGVGYSTREVSTSSGVHPSEIPIHLIGLERFQKDITIFASLMKIAFFKETSFSLSFFESNRSGRSCQEEASIIADRVLELMRDFRYSFFGETWVEEEDDDDEDSEDELFHNKENHKPRKASVCRSVKKMNDKLLPHSCLLRSLTDKSPDLQAALFHFFTPFIGASEIDLVDDSHFCNYQTESEYKRIPILPSPRQKIKCADIIAYLSNCCSGSHYEESMDVLLLAVGGKMNKTLGLLRDVLNEEAGSDAGLILLIQHLTSESFSVDGYLADDVHYFNHLAILIQDWVNNRLDVQGDFGDVLRYHVIHFLRAYFFMEGKYHYMISHLREGGSKELVHASSFIRWCCYDESHQYSFINSSVLFLADGSEKTASVIYESFLFNKLKSDMVSLQLPAPIIDISESSDHGMKDQQLLWPQCDPIKAFKFLESIVDLGKKIENKIAGFNHESSSSKLWHLIESRGCCKKLGDKGSSKKMKKFKIFQNLLAKGYPLHFLSDLLPPLRPSSVGNLLSKLALWKQVHGWESYSSLHSGQWLDALERVDLFDTHIPSIESKMVSYESIAGDLIDTINIYLRFAQSSQLLLCSMGQWNTEANTTSIAALEQTTLLSEANQLEQRITMLSTQRDALLKHASASASASGKPSLLRKHKTSSSTNHQISTVKALEHELKLAKKKLKDLETQRDRSYRDHLIASTADRASIVLAIGLVLRLICDIDLGDDGILESANKRFSNSSEDGKSNAMMEDVPITLLLCGIARKDTYFLIQLLVSTWRDSEKSADTIADVSGAMMLSFILKTPDLKRGLSLISFNSDPSQDGPTRMEVYFSKVSLQTAMECVIGGGNAQKSPESPPWSTLSLLSSYALLGSQLVSYIGLYKKEEAPVGAQGNPTTIQCSFGGVVDFILCALTNEFPQQVVYHLLSLYHSDAFDSSAVKGFALRVNYDKKERAQQLFKDATASLSGLSKSISSIYTKLIRAMFTAGQSLHYIGQIRNLPKDVKSIDLEVSGQTAQVEDGYRDSRVKMTTECIRTRQTQKERAVIRNHTIGLLSEDRASKKPFGVNGVDLAIRFFAKAKNEYPFIALPTSLPLPTILHAICLKDNEVTRECIKVSNPSSIYYGLPEDMTPFVRSLNRR